MRRASVVAGVPVFAAPGLPWCNGVARKPKREEPELPMIFDFFARLVRQRVQGVQIAAKSKVYSAQARAKGKASTAFNKSVDGVGKKAKGAVIGGGKKAKAAPSIGETVPIKSPVRASKSN